MDHSESYPHSNTFPELHKIQNLFQLYPLWKHDRGRNVKKSTSQPQYEERNSQKRLTIKKTFNYRTPKFLLCLKVKKAYIRI